MSVNKVILIGNLGRDPEVRRTASGRTVANLNIATSRRYKDRDGEFQESTEWHRVVVWGAAAENCERYLSKGRSVYVEGRLETDKWTDREGVERTTTQVVAVNVRFLGSGATRTAAAA